MNFREKIQKALEFYYECLEDGRLKKDILKDKAYQDKLNWLAQNDFPKKLINVRDIDENFVFPSKHASKHADDFKNNYGLTEDEAKEVDDSNDSLEA